MPRPLVAVLLLVGAALPLACGGAVPPPPPAPTPPLASASAEPLASSAPSASAAPRASAAPSASAAAPKPATSAKRPARPAPPRLEEPLPPLTRAFVKVKLPGIKDPLISVSGRGPRDLVFLSQESHELYHNRYQFYRGTVIRSDGERVIDSQVPCPGYDYQTLVAGGDEVLVLGSNMFFRNVPGRYLATLSGKKSWSCGSGHAQGLAVASGGLAWMLTCGYGGADCTLSAPGMPQVRLPRFDASLSEKETPSAEIDAMWMQGADDGWITHATADGGTALLRYNGVSWSTKATLDGLAMMGMWVDPANQVWLLARRNGGDNNPGDTLLRFDGKTLEELRVPATFGATEIRATGPKDIWFVGAGTAVYQWDGQRLRAGEAPFAVGDAYAAPGGELWIVGLEEERGPGPGVAAHTAPAAKEVR